MITKGNEKDARVFTRFCGSPSLQLYLAYYSIASLILNAAFHTAYAFHEFLAIVSLRLLTSLLLATEIPQLIFPDSNPVCGPASRLVNFDDIATIIILNTELCLVIAYCTNEQSISKESKKKMKYQLERSSRSEKGRVKIGIEC